MSQSTPLSQASPLQIQLPWPHQDLSPNARVHWARKSRRVAEARSKAHLLTRAEIGPRKPGWAGAKLEVVFCPPDKRRRDRDNLIASMKAANDGIADALGIDDSRFVSTYSMGEPVKGGAVHVTVRAA